MMPGSGRQVNKKLLACRDEELAIKVRNIWSAVASGARHRFGLRRQGCRYSPNLGLLSRRPWNIQTEENQSYIMKPHRATLILVLGILSLVLCAPLGIAAWIMGNGDLKQIDAGTMDPSGRSTTNAGRICGIIGTILLGLGILSFIALFALGLMGSVMGHR